MSGGADAAEMLRLALRGLPFDTHKPSPVEFRCKCSYERVVRIVTAAMRRGVWAMAVDSIVEHVHHYFGKAPVDDTYRLGESSFAADRALFRTRSAANR